MWEENTLSSVAVFQFFFSSVKRRRTRLKGGATKWNFEFREAIDFCLRASQRPLSPIVHGDTFVDFQVIRTKNTISKRRQCHRVEDYFGLRLFAVIQQTSSRLRGPHREQMNERNQSVVNQPSLNELVLRQYRRRRRFCRRRHGTMTHASSPGESSLDFFMQHSKAGREGMVIIHHSNPRIDTLNLKVSDNIRYFEACLENWIIQLMNTTRHNSNWLITLGKTAKTISLLAPDNGRAELSPRTNKQVSSSFFVYGRRA